MRKQQPGRSGTIWPRCGTPGFIDPHTHPLYAGSRENELGLKLKVHADELAASGGAELAARLGAASAEHLLQASDTGIKQMAEKGVVAVLLPATSFNLTAHAYARARDLSVHILSISWSQASGLASLGMRQSPRGERAMEPTLGPSGRQERLNCCEKNLA